MVFYIPNDSSNMTLYTLNYTLIPGSNISLFIWLCNMYQTPFDIYSSLTDIVSACNNIPAVDKSSAIAADMQVVFWPVFRLVFWLNKMMALLNNPFNLSTLTIMLSVITGVMGILCLKFIKI